MIRSAQKTFAKAFAKDEDGATAIEYASWQPS
jgi:Flp pilus assembly pilin Flp